MLPSHLPGIKHLNIAQQLLTHMRTSKSRWRFAMNLFSINCQHTGTFPAVCSLQHPLVVNFVWGHPLSAHAVSGEIPVPLRSHCLCLSARATIIILMIKYPWQLVVFLLVGTSAFFASICDSGLQLVPKYEVLWLQLSTWQTYDFFFLLLTPSLGSALPFFFLLMFFFSFSLSLFLSHYIPFIANRACGLWSLDLSLCVMCECVFSGTSVWRAWWVGLWTHPFLLQCEARKEKERRGGADEVWQLACTITLPQLRN